MNRQSGVKILLSVITALIVLGHLIGFLNRRCHVNPKWSNIYPANLIRLAYSRNKHVRANTICVVNVHILHTQWELVSSYWPKFTALRLFVETMPIYKAVATGNRNIELYRENDTFNLQIATMPDRTWITVFIPTPLIFRYHLPFKTCSLKALSSEMDLAEIRLIR